jgi:hypothetical protein
VTTLGGRDTLIIVRQHLERGASRHIFAARRNLHARHLAEVA